MRRPLLAFGSETAGRPGHANERRASQIHPEHTSCKLQAPEVTLEPRSDRTMTMVTHVHATCGGLWDARQQLPVGRTHACRMHTMRSMRRACARASPNLLAKAVLCLEPRASIGTHAYHPNTQGLTNMDAPTASRYRYTTCASVRWHWARPVRAVRLAPMRSLDLARSSAKLTSKPVLVAYSSSAQAPSRISPAPAALRPHGLMAGTVLDHSRRGGADRSKRTRS